MLLDSKSDLLFTYKLWNSGVQALFVYSYFFYVPNHVLEYSQTQGLSKL